MRVALASPAAEEEKQHRPAHEQEIGPERRRELGGHAQIKDHLVPASLTAVTVLDPWTRSTSSCADPSMRRKTGAGYTPSQMMTAMSGTRSASSRLLRSGMSVFSGLSSGLKRMRWIAHSK